MNTPSTFPETPNGSAYTRTESRNGVPLDYVGEKLRHAVESAHENLRNIKRFVPENLPAAPEFQYYVPNGIKNDLLLSSANNAFSYSLQAYLALHNMLGKMEIGSIEAELEKKNFQELRRWLNAIEKEGSVLG